MNKYRGYGPGITFKCGIDLQPTLTNLSNATSIPQGEQLCPFISKSMYKCRSYGAGKLIL